MTHLGPHWQSQSPYQSSWSNLYNSRQRMDETANWYINNSEQQQGSWQRPVTRRFPTSDTRKPGKQEYNDPCYYCMELGHPKRECEKYAEVKRKFNQERNNGNIGEYERLLSEAKAQIERNVRNIDEIRD